MAEFHIGERVRFVRGADVSDKALAHTAIVKGYVEFEGQDLVLVSVLAKPRFEQVVLSTEIVSLDTPPRRSSQPSDADMSLSEGEMGNVEEQV